MTFQGHVQNGLIIPDSPLGLADGVKVEIRIAADAPTKESPANPDDPLGPDDSLMKFCGIFKDMEPDASQRVDEVLYGIKRDE